MRNIHGAAAEDTADPQTSDCAPAAKQWCSAEPRGGKTIGINSGAQLAHIGRSGVRLDAGMSIPFPALSGGPRTRNAAQPERPHGVAATGGGGCMVSAQGFQNIPGCVSSDYRRAAAGIRVTSRMPEATPATPTGTPHPRWRMNSR